MIYENLQGASRVGHGVLPKGADAPHAGAGGDPLLFGASARASQSGNDFAGGWRAGPVRCHDCLSHAHAVQGGGIDPRRGHAAQGGLFRLERAWRQFAFPHLPWLRSRDRTGAARSVLDGNRAARIRAWVFTGAGGLRSPRLLPELQGRAQNSNHAVETGPSRQTFIRLLNLLDPQDYGLDYAPRAARHPRLHRGFKMCFSSGRTIPAFCGQTV